VDLSFRELQRGWPPGPRLAGKQEYIDAMFDNDETLDTQPIIVW